VSVEGEDIAGYLKEVDALIVGTTPVTGSMLRGSKVKIIAKHGVGWTI